MKIDNSVYWDVDRSVGDKVVRANDGRINSYVGAEGRSGEGERFEYIFKIKLVLGMADVSIKLSKL